MLVNADIVALLDQAEHIGQLINLSEQMENYNQAKKQLAEDKEAQALIATFEKKKDQYEEVKRFGRYHPDYSKITKEIRVIKREVDMHDTVAAFKIAERDIQMLLDDVSERIAFSVSKQIKVPRDGALFTDSGCGCGSGGGCGCKAS